MFVAPLMLQRIDFTDDRELERELLAQPAFAGGTLKFVRRLSARHSGLLEYSFRSEGGIKSLVVKQQELGPNSELATLQELANLARARNLLGLALARSVPEPLLALPKRGMLVTSKIPGVPLAPILKKYANRLVGPFRSYTLGETARRVGMWLRGFQDATHGEPVPYNRDSYLAELEMRLLQVQEKGFEPGLIRQILQKASLRSAPLNGRLISTAAKHGDFIAQNILIDGGAVGVVDFEGFGEREPVYDDLGMFLGYILVLGGRALYSRQSLDTVRRGFLAGFLAGDTIDQALLDIYILKGAVRVIADGPPLTGNWDQFSLWMLTKRLRDLASDRAM